jgi:hypothetical protein
MNTRMIAGAIVHVVRRLYYQFVACTISSSPVLSVIVSQLFTPRDQV